MNWHGSCSATVLGTTRLKSDIAEWFKNGYSIAAVRNAPVAQLDRAFDYESKGRKFESCRAHLKTKDLWIILKSSNPQKVT
jgi:hypothetical protein